MHAVGAYLRTLREGQRIPRQKLAEQFNTSLSNITRIEDGEQETRGSLLFALVRALHGNPLDIEDLLSRETVTVEDARNLARRRLYEPALAVNLPAPEVMTDDEIGTELAVIEELKTQLVHNPDVVDQVRDFIRFLIGQKRPAGGGGGVPVSRRSRVPAKFGRQRHK